MYFFGWFAGRRSGDSFAIKKGFVCLLSVVKGDRKHNVLKCKMFENHPQTYNILHHYNGTFKVNVLSEKFLILIVKHKTNSKWENLIRMSEFLTLWWDSLKGFKLMHEKFKCLTIISKWNEKGGDCADSASTKYYSRWRF